MPSFRALPPSLLRQGTRGGADTAPDARRIHVPVARAMVDCGVYCDGSRLPGKYTHGAAL
ncbi:magnesium transporter, partial [Mycobacterium sp. ITM-2017-0098]